MYLDKLLKGKEKKEKLLLIGLGQEIKQLLTWLVEVIDYPKDYIYLADKNNINLENYQKYEGENYLKNSLNQEYLFVFKAPGIWSKKPELEEYRMKYGKDKILSSMVFFLESFRENTVMITGTKGKTTTSSLIYHFLKTKLEGKNIEYCGNTTNISPYSFWKNIEDKLDNYFFVIETSSFQLQDLGPSQISPKYAIITNLFIDHLDQHDNKLEYWESKDNIFKFQSKDDYLIVSQQAKENLDSRKALIKSKIEEINQIKIDDFNKHYTTKLLGDHNKTNILLAYYICSKINSKYFDLQKVLDTFEPPKGRLELIMTKNIDQKNINFYDDNTASEPDAVIAGLKALSSKENSQIILFISGKLKKGNHFELLQLINKLKKEEKILHVYYFGEVGVEMKKLNGDKDIVFESFKTFLQDNESIKKIINQSKSNNIDIVLSPAGSSFDEFANYIIRGEEFKKWVLNF
jgi:UDP-N-acetylmuramoyl-L-alanine---L-glutamate ligase